MRSLILYVSIEPKRFNHVDLIDLFWILRRRYANEPKVEIQLYDLKVAAKNHANSEHDPNFGRDAPANRGRIYWNDEERRAFIKYATKRGELQEPTFDKEIDCSAIFQDEKASAAMDTQPNY